MKGVSTRYGGRTRGRVAAPMSGEGLRGCRKGPTPRGPQAAYADQASCPGPVSGAGSLLSGSSARINVPLPGVDEITICPPSVSSR